MLEAELKVANNKEAAAIAFSKLLNVELEALAEAEKALEKAKKYSTEKLVKLKEKYPNGNESIAKEEKTLANIQKDITLCQIDTKIKKSHVEKATRDSAEAEVEIARLKAAITIENTRIETWKKEKKDNLKARINALKEGGKKEDGDLKTNREQNEKERVATTSAAAIDAKDVKVDTKHTKS